MVTCLVAWAAVAAPGVARAGDVCTPPRLLVVLDRSSSMRGPIDDADKWSVAAGALAEVLDRYQDTVDVGLMPFPSPSACGPGRIVVAPGPHQRDPILAALAEPPPLAGNWTPLGETLLAAARDPLVIDGDPRARTAVVVITDGFQWCSPYDPTSRGLPIEGVRALAAKKIETFVVGLSGGVDEDTLAAMAVAGGTARPGCDPAAGLIEGCYFQADDAGGLVEALMTVARSTTEERCNGLDDDCDGQVDEAACVVPPPVVDAGVGDAGLDPGEVAGGCGCGAGSGGVGGGLGVALAFALAGRRRRSPRGGAARLGGADHA
jgi:von Willebrand factor type A domain/Putative metal-binding motif